MNKNKSKLYKKLVINYTLVVIILIIGINFIFFNKLKEQNLSNMLDINFRMLKDVEKEINQMEKTVRTFMSDLYSDSTIINDLIFLLNNEYIDYTKNKLDAISTNRQSYYKGIEYLVDRAIEKNKYIDGIEFISYSMKKAYLFENKGLTIKELSENDLNNIHKQFDITINNNQFLYTNEIKNPNNLKIEGVLIFKFNMNSISEILLNYGKENEIFILNKYNEIIYSLNKNINDDIYETKESLFKENFKINSNYNVIELNSGIILLGKINKIISRNINLKSLFYFLILSIIFFFLSEIFIIKKFGRLNDRINAILETMKNIGNGNKTLRIPNNVSIELDEISIIAKSFNEMCDRLEDSIKKRYIAEINQKNAEMNALQSSINPHFLYNTLEAIRMKAIINKDKEVGKMIYLLAHLYRSQLKEKGIITIRSEMEYCDKFLQIHKFRYNDQFSYSIKCEEHLLNKEIIKFTLQPLIENYFVHGIRLQDKDNQVNISIIHDKNNIKITIKDNGRGIPKEKLNKVLKNIKYEENFTENFGIYNVHKRIVNKYGNEYGVFIESEIEKGTTITVIFPYE